MDYMKCTFEQLVADAKANHNVDFLKKALKKNPKISYIELKRRYFQEFYPEMVPVAKAKAKTFRELIEEL